MRAPELFKLEELGQVWTPDDLALEMTRDALELVPSPSKILDPSCGPGTFSRALHSAGVKGAKVYCYDVDLRMTDATAVLNKGLGLRADVHLKDYLLDTSLAGQFDMVIMNPPYIRQEDISLGLKDSYHKYLSVELGENVGRQANLFVLFLLKGLVDLKSGGILCAIVYDAISQSAYGKKTLKLMKRHAELVSQRHVKTPFEGVLVDAQIVLYRKRASPLLEDISENVCPSEGLVPLVELVDVRRGTGLPFRKAFLAYPSDPYYGASEPLFMKQAKLSGLTVVPDQRVYLADAITSYKVASWLKSRAESLGRGNLKLGVKGVRGKILFNYYIRNAARHLWNPNEITASDNFYVSTPKEEFPAEVSWLLLNSTPYLSRLTAAARNQGNGLSKLQLYEYKSVNVPDWRLISKKKLAELVKLSKTLIESSADFVTVRNAADKSVAGIFQD